MVLLVCNLSIDSLGVEFKSPVMMLSLINLHYPKSDKIPVSKSHWRIH